MAPDAPAVSLLEKTTFIYLPGPILPLFTPVHFNTLLCGSTLEKRNTNFRLAVSLFFGYPRSVVLLFLPLLHLYLTLPDPRSASPR